MCVCVCVCVYHCMLVVHVVCVVFDHFVGHCVCDSYVLLSVHVCLCGVCLCVCLCAYTYNLSGYVCETAEREKNKKKGGERMSKTKRLSN